MIYQSELTCILGNMTREIGQEGVRFNNLEKRGYDPLFSKGQIMIIQYWILSQWQQNDDGTTFQFSNYISQEEFDELISQVRVYAACS